jgi:DNA-binding IclR family transcriptional regulator
MIALAEAIDAGILRIHHEFLEMPGLVLTVAQTARLYALSTAHAKRLLETLEAEGFLVSGPSGVYRRSTPPTCD